MTFQEKRFDRKKEEIPGGLQKKKKVIMDRGKREKKEGRKQFKARRLTGSN